MKKGKLKELGIIIALVAAIGFMAACDSPSNPEDDFVAVRSITDVPTSGMVGNLTLYGTVNPSYATNKTIVWSVVNAGTTGASISGNTLTTTAAGTVTVMATVVNGSAQGTNYTQNFYISINTAGGNPSAITYTITQTGGLNGQTNSTGIVFNFSESVDSLNLTAADITVSGAASKGSGVLTGSGAMRTIPITVNFAGLAYVTIDKDGIETGTKDVIVYKAGEMAPEYWTITWNLNGGTAGMGVQYPTLIVKDTVLVRPLPNPTKAGNTFGGWYANYALTQEYDFTSPVAADLYLYAKWKTEIQPTEYWSITWHLDGGTAGMDAQHPTQIVKDTVLARPSPDPTKDDNTFDSWYVDSDLTQEYNFTDRVTGNLNLYAKWVVSSGEEVTIAMWDNFGDGWDNNAALRINVNGINRTTNARLTDGYAGYHRFMVNAGDVVQIYWLNGSSKDTEIAFAVYYSDNPPSPEFNPSTGTTDTTRVLVSKRYNSPSWSVGNGTLMGSFTAVGGTDSEHWSITWHLNSGTAGTGAQHPTQILKDTVLARPSPDPTKDGYTFDDWYTDYGLTQTYNFANPITWHLSLYAKWEEIPPAAGITVPGDTLVEKLAWVQNEDNV